MPKKKPETPRSRVRSAIRQLWLRSREHAKALKDAQYTCQICGVKKSVAKGKEQKVIVHHTHGIGNWEKVIDIIFEEILCSPDKLEVLCPKCHKEKHDTKTQEREIKEVS